MSETTRLLIYAGAFAFGVLIVVVFMARFNPIADIRFARQQAAFRAGRKRWLERLKADPRRAPYVARIEAGEPWTEARITYDLDPEHRETCAHLAPIEGDMRAAGLRIWFDGRAGQIEADCVIDQAALAARYDLPEGVGYREVHIADRSLLDPPTPWVSCGEHGSSILVAPEGRERPGTPRFPA